MAVAGRRIPSWDTTSPACRVSTRGAKMHVRLPAISARRIRRRNSSLLPENIGPQTTSSQPQPSGTGGIPEAYAGDSGGRPPVGRLALEVVQRVRVRPVRLDRPDLAREAAVLAAVRVPARVEHDPAAVRRPVAHAVA